MTPEESAEMMLEAIRTASKKDADKLLRLTIKSNKLKDEAEKLADAAEEIANAYGFGICVECCQWVNIQSCLLNKNRERVCLTCVGDGAEIDEVWGEYDY